MRPLGLGQNDKNTKQQMKQGKTLFLVINMHDDTNLLFTLSSNNPTHTLHFHP